jgi:ABC-2 type transport system permease protein
MNYVILKPLIQKDWYLQRFVILGYSLAGVVALVMVNLQNQFWANIGNLLLISVLLAFGFHLAISNIISERNQHTLPFIMSLPVSVREYTLGKILANLIIYLVPWTILSIAGFVVILARDNLPDGLIPFITLIFVQLLVNYCFALMTALITESVNWIIGAVLLGNVVLQGFLGFISNSPNMKINMTGSSVIWDATTFLILVAQLSAIAIFFGITFLVQAKKTDFV